MSAQGPFLSVVVPAHRGEHVLCVSLPALRASTLPRERWELIVVDDASPDATAEVAGGYADHVVRLGGTPHGPAHARNHGTEVSRGDIVVFIDADVVVHADTLAKFADAFEEDRDLAAVFGSYDADPAAPGLVSQFRNLLHHHVHHEGAGPAETFWAGCGAVRRDVLAEVGMYDAARYPRPQIEDIELGRRLRRAGHRIALRPDIQCTHLKRWTLRNMVVTDFRDRGVPWTMLLLGEGRSGGSSALNLKASDKLCTALVALIGLSLASALALWSPAPLVVAAVAVAAIVLLNRRFYGRLVRARGLPFALACLPLHLVFYFIGGLGAVAGTVRYYTVGSPRPLATQQDSTSDRAEPNAWAVAASRSRE